MVGMDRQLEVMEAVVTEVTMVWVVRVVMMEEAAMVLVMMVVVRVVTTAPMAREVATVKRQLVCK